MSNQDFDFDPDAPPGSDTANWLLRQQQRSLVNALPSADDDPDKAGRAMELSRATGTPPALIYADQENFEEQHKARLTAQLLRSNKFLMDYAANPMAAKVSGDDWGQLASVSHALDPFGKDWKSILAKGAERFKEGWGGTTWGGWLPTAGDDYRLAWSIITAAGIPFELGAKVFGGIAGATTGMLGEYGKQMGFKEAPKLTEDAFQVAMDPAFWASMGPIGEMVGLPFEAAGFNAKLSAAAKQGADLVRKVEPYARSGEPPPVGLDPLIDKVHTEQAKLDLKALDDAFKESEKSATRERDPDLFAQFIRQHTDAKIGISADALRALYGDGRPEPGDAKLGWIPGIADQYDLALATGTDIEVPLSEWLAKASPEVHEEAREGLRLRQGGMTVEEAGEPKAAEAPTEEGVLPGPLASIREASGLIPKGQTQPTLPQGIIPEKTLLGEMVERPGKGLSVPTVYSFPASEAIAKIDKDRLTGVPRALAEFFGDKLNKLVGDVPVKVVDQEGMNTLTKGLKLEPTTPAYYDPNTHEIIIRQDIAEGSLGHNTIAHVMMHEGAHAFTSRALDEFPLLKSHVKAMLNETLTYLIHNDPTSHAIHDYAFKNEHEFVAEAFSNPRFQEVLATTPLSYPLAKRLGLKEGRATTWDAMKGIIRDLIERLVGVKMPDTMLDGLLHLGPSFEEAHKQISGDIGAQIHPARLPTQLELQGLTRLEDRALFQRAKDIDMKGEHLERWLKLIVKRAEEDSKFQQDRLAKEERERQTKEWKENLADVRKEVEADLRNRPDLAADRFLRDGELYGEKVKRPGLNPEGLDPELAKRIPQDFLKAEGMNPDDVARLVGYQSGDGMAAALARLEDERNLEGLTTAAHYSRLVDVETEREMRKRYGDLEENLLEAAKDHVTSPTQLDMIAEEMLALGMKNNAEISLTKEDMKAWVKEKFNATPLSALSRDSFLAASGRAEKEIQAGLLEGRENDAFKAYQQKYLNLLFAAEAKKLDKEKATFEKTAKRFAKREVGGVLPEYTNWIHDILIRTGNPVRRSVQDLGREIAASPSATLRDFVNSRNNLPEIFGEDELSAPAGLRLPVADFLLDPEYRKPVEDMTAEEFRAVHDSIKTLVKNGSEEDKLEVQGKKRGIRDVVGQMAQQMEHAKGREIVYSPGDRSRSISKTLGVWVLNVESWMDRLDMGNARGIFNQAIIRPVSEGINNLAALEKRFAKEFREVGDFGDLSRKVENDLVIDPLYKRPAELTRGHVLAMIQNAGNPLQLKKLALGWGVKDPNKLLEFLFRNSEKEDWDRAQHLGDLFGRIFELSADMYRNLSGVAPAKIDLRPIDTPFGTYDGWYHPLVADPERAGDVAKKMGNMMEESGYYRPAPASGYTKGRTGAIYPLLLNFDFIPFKIKTMLNDIAMRPAILQTAKLFGDSEFKQNFSKYVGKEYREALEPWLRDAAGQRRYMTPAQQTGAMLADFVRENIISNLIGLNPGTVMKHGPTAAIMSMKQVGIQSFWREFSHLLAHDPESGERNWQFALRGGTVDGHEWTGSQELQRRFRNWIETLSGSQEEVFDLGSRFMTLRRAIQHIGAAPVAFSDLLSAVPTWLARYHDLRDEGLSHGDAVFEADKAVRQAHGSSAVTNRPEAMRGGALSRYLVPFYNFFNTVLNRQYETAWKAKLVLENRPEIAEPTEGPISVRPGQTWDPDRLQQEFQNGKGRIRSVMGGLFAYVIAPAIIEQLVSPVYTKQDPWSVVAAKALAYDLSASWPVLRDAMNYALGGHDPSIGVYSTGIEDIGKVINDVKKGQISMNPAHAAKTIRHANSLFGLATGMSNEEIGKLGQYMYSVTHGQERPRGAADIYHGVRYGTQREFRK